MSNALTYPENQIDIISLFFSGMLLITKGTDATLLT